MKRSWKYFRQYVPWLVLLLAVDAFSSVLLWLADVRAFRALSLVILLVTVFLFVAVFGAAGYLAQKREQAFLAFIHNPDESCEETLLRLTGAAEKDSIRLLGAVLRGKENAYTQALAELSDYEEYVESWAHEAKTPLSLLTLLLDNRRDQIPKNMEFKLDYIRNQMEQMIEQMLFYARLKGTQKDYLYEFVELGSIVDEVLEDFSPLLEEKEFQVSLQNLECQVYTDRRGLRFLLSQLISNAVKYSAADPEIHIQCIREVERIVLSVRDNGIGVQSCDLPYIFQKGFTGDSGEKRKKATGMGLYLANEIAGELNLSLNAVSQRGRGFEMRIAFPIVRTKREKDGISCGSCVQSV